jgi:outer membrane biosynthesis protein TonB
MAQAHGGSTVGSKVADSDNRRLRSIELWLNAALLVIAAIGIIAIGAFAMQFVATDTPNPPAAARAASPVSVPTPERPAEAACAGVARRARPRDHGGATEAAPPAAPETPPAEQPSAAAIAEPASPPPPPPAHPAHRRPPRHPPRPHPRAAPAPRAE